MQKLAELNGLDDRGQRESKLVSGALLIPRASRLVNRKRPVSSVVIRINVVMRRATGIPQESTSNS